MKARKPNVPRFSEQSGRATGVLARGETRLVLIEALAVMMVQMMLYMLLTQTAMTVEMSLGPVGSATYERFSNLVILLWLLTVSLVGLFVSVPLWVGFLRMAARATDGEEILLVMLFEPFSSWRAYRRAVGLGWMPVWRVLLLVFVVAITCIALEGSGVVGIFVGVLLVIGELLLFFCLYARRLFVAAVVLKRDMSLREAKRMTKKWRGIACTVRFGGYALLWWMLGLLTVGILLVWDTLPRMAVMYFGYAEEMETNMIQLEEDKHE